MRYGIIGTGWIAESFAAGARLVCNSEIAAVYSRTEEKGNAFAQRNNIPLVYTDIDEFANGDFDAVYIASPNSCHAPQSEKMMLAGKHVICEKPVTVTPEELERCIGISEETGRVYMEAIMYMHTPNREKLKDALDKIGIITSAHFDFSQLSSKYAAYKAGGTPNIFNPELGTGGLMDLGVYCVYPALDLFGMPHKINADAVFLRTGADSSGSCSLNYGDKIITLTYSKTGQDYAGSFIYGDNGTIEIESVSKVINAVLIDKDGNREVVCPEMTKEEIMGCEAKEFEEFVSGTKPEKYALSKERSLQVSKVMQIIREKAGIKLC